MKEIEMQKLTLMVLSNPKSIDKIINAIAEDDSSYGCNIHSHCLSIVATSAWDTYRTDEKRNKAIDIDNIYQKYKYKLLDNDYLYTIVKVVGDTGLSDLVELKNNKEIKEIFKVTGGGINQGRLVQSLKSLEELDILDSLTIDFEFRLGKSKFYRFSDLGKEIYTHIFKRNPLKSEIDTIKEKHATIDEGYLLKYTMEELKSKGYSTTQQNVLLDNFCSTEDSGADSERKLTLYRDGSKYQVVCMANNVNVEFVTALIENLIVSDTVTCFVASTQGVLNNINAMVDKWITKKGIDTLKGHTFKFTTLKQLHKSKKETWLIKGPF